MCLSQPTIERGECTPLVNILRSYPVTKYKGACLQVVDWNPANHQTHTLVAGCFARKKVCCTL